MEGMPTFRVNMTYEFDVTFYLEAEARGDVDAFLERMGPDWRPGDVPGLIDTVGEEVEMEYNIIKDAGDVVAAFRVKAGGSELEELD